MAVCASPGQGSSPAASRSNTQVLKMMQAFKEGAVRFLICTDVAARGLDISGLPYVINVTLPDRAEDYIHRVGRVGEVLMILIHSLF